MDIKQKKIERQLELWPLLGPFILSATLIVLLIKPVQHPLYIPLTALTGTFLCWRWKLAGLAAALGLLVGVVAYQMSHEVFPKAAVWDFTLGIAVALSFTVTALSFKEVQEVIFHLQTESSSRLDRFLQVDEKIRSLEQSRESEAAANREKIELISRQLSEKTTQLQSYEKVVELAREEMLHAVKENERLLQESLQRRHECELMKGKLEEAESEIKSLCDQMSAKPEAEASIGKTDLAQEARQQAIIHELNDHIETLNREKNLLETALKALQTELEAVRKVLEEKETQSRQDHAEIAFLQQNNSEDKQSAEELKKSLTIKDEELDKEVKAFLKMKGMYLQLREQFEEKNLVLENTRRELFLTNEALLKYQRELDEERLYGTEENTPPAFLSYTAKLGDEMQMMEQLHEEETSTLYELIDHLITGTIAPSGPALINAEKKEPIKKEKVPVKPKAPSKKQAASKQEAKQKKNKATKTTAWANTILSRWSSLEEQ